MFNPDNRLIATGSENAIRLVDVIDGSHVRTLEPCNNLLVLYTSGDVGHAELSQVTSVAFDPNGRWLASACDGDAAVTLWDVTTGRPIRRIPALPAPAGSYCMSSGRPPPCLGGEPPLSRPDGLLAMAVSPDGQWLATGARDRTMRVWDLATGRLLLERGGHSNAIDSLTFSTDSRFLASSDHSTATLWQLPNGTAVRQTPAHATVAIGPDQRWLTATYDNYRMTIKVWNIAAGKDEASVPSQEQSAAVLSPDGRFLIAPQRGAPTLIDMATREATAMVDATPATWRLAFSPDGRWAALQPFFLFRLPPAPATAAALVTDPRTATTVWRIGTDRFLTLPGPAGAGDAKFSADGRVLAGSGDDRIGGGPAGDSRTIRVWEASSGRMLAALSSPWTTRFALSPDGRWVAAVGNDTTTARNGVLRIWNAATGDLVRVQTGRWSGDVAFSPDSRWLVASSNDTVSLQEVESGREVRALAGRSPFAFSPDGRWLVTAGGVREVLLQVWDVGSGNLIRTIPYGTRPDIPVLAISANAQWLVAGGWQQQDGVRLWDLTTGQAVRSFTGYSAGFSADGTRLRVAGYDGTTRFWDTRDGSLVASLVFCEDSSDWVIAANDGRVDGSEAGLRKLVSWRVGETVYPADRFLENYRSPGLLEQVLDGR